MNTEIIAILDESGSMQPLRGETISGFNRFVEEQMKVPGEAKITAVRFNTRVAVIFSGVALQTAPPLTEALYNPDGYTALLDAIGATLNGEGARIAAEKWAEKVVCLIVTDGMENASHEYTDAKIKQMIAHAEAHGWSFVYMGANQDAFTVGRSMGISGQTVTMGANAAGTRAAYATATMSVSSLRGGAADLASVDLTKTAADLTKADQPPITNTTKEQKS